MFGIYVVGSWRVHYKYTVFVQIRNAALIKFSSFCVRYHKETGSFVFYKIDTQNQ